MVGQRGRRTAREKGRRGAMNSYVLKMWGRVGQLRNVCRTNTRDKHEVAGCTDHCTGRTGLRLKFYVAWPALLGLSNSTAPCMHHKLIDSRAVPCMPRLPTLLPKARRTDDLWTSCWPAAEKKEHVSCFFAGSPTETQISSPFPSRLDFEHFA